MQGNIRAVARAVVVAAAGILVAASPAGAQGRGTLGPEVRVEYAAGTGMSGVPTPGPARLSRISSAFSQAIDSKGNVYSADYNQSAIEKLGADGTLSIVTGLHGTGAPLAGPAVESPMPWPTSVAVDG